MQESEIHKMDNTIAGGMTGGITVSVTIRTGAVDCGFQRTCQKTIDSMSTQQVGAEILQFRITGNPSQ